MSDAVEASIMARIKELRNHEQFHLGAIHGHQEDIETETERLEKVRDQLRQLEEFATKEGWL